MLRLACLFLIGAELLLLALFLRPNGATAIAVTFVGTPLLAAGAGLALVWLLRRMRHVQRKALDRAAALRDAG
jgi:hypothetical protein